MEVSRELSSRPTSAYTTGEDGNLSLPSPDTLHYCLYHTFAFSQRIKTTRKHIQKSSVAHRRRSEKVVGAFQQASLKTSLGTTKCVLSICICDVSEAELPLRYIFSRTTFSHVRQGTTVNHMCGREKPSGYVQYLFPFVSPPHPPFINGFCNYWQQGIGSWQKVVTSAVDCLQEAGYIGCFSIEAYDVHVLSLLTPLTPKREPADMLFVFSTCLPSWMSHYLTSHKYTYRCGNTEGEACSAHIKNSYWRCQQGAQRSWFRGNLKEKYGTLLLLQPLRLGVGLEVLFLTLLKRDSTPGALALESIAKSRQMHLHRWWMLRCLGMLAEFPVSWQDKDWGSAPTSVPINNCQWVWTVTCRQ